MQKGRPKLHIEEDAAGCAEGTSQIEHCKNETGLEDKSYVQFGTSLLHIQPLHPFAQPKSARSAKSAERPTRNGLTRSRANGLRGAGAPREIGLLCRGGTPNRTFRVQFEGCAKGTSQIAHRRSLSAQSLFSYVRFGTSLLHIPGSLTNCAIWNVPFAHQANFACRAGVTQGGTNWLKSACKLASSRTMDDDRYMNSGGLMMNVVSRS